MATPKFVATSSIRNAVAGQEPKILQALGIQWTGSQSHIHCPYPDHEDLHPSWRWDAGKKRAYCTCGGSDSIFDIIAKTRRIDFDAAKIMAAEIIGRPDLIRETRKNGGRGKGERNPADNTATAQHPGGCTLAAYAKAKQLKADVLSSFGISEIYHSGQPALRIPYCGPDGGEVAVRFRIALGAADKFRWKKGDKAQLYGLDRLAAAHERSEIAIVEGESDCHTLWQSGFPAIGLPGAGNWKEERDAPLFEGMSTIYVVIEPDNGGDAVRKWLSSSKIRDRVKIVRLNGFKDPSALYLDDPGRFAERWRATLDDAVL